LSIFKTKWIILKINKISQKNILYTVFTADFWKININKKLSKKEKMIDLWYNINFEIIEKKNENISKMKNVKIISSFNYENKNFENIQNYLSTIAYVLKNTPNWVPILEIYNILGIINKRETLSNEKFLLINLKIKNILWILNPNSPNKIIFKILNFINKNNIKEILKLTWLNWELIKELENKLKSNPWEIN